MRRNLLIALGFSLFMAAPVLATLSYHSYAFRKQYIVSVADAQLSASPSWANDAENPPLSARKAVLAATEMRKMLASDTSDFRWRMSSASLIPTENDNWHWLIEFEAKVLEPGGSTGRRHTLRLVVLMDGTVIKPSVTDYEW